MINNAWQDFNDAEQQQGFERQQVLFQVVDQQEVDRFFGHRHAGPRLDRYDAIASTFMMVADGQASRAAKGMAAA